MASLLEKVNTLIQANLHWLVDQALKQNSIAVINQYIREVEDNLEDLTSAVATVGGNVKTVRRKHDELQARYNELDRNIDLFLREGRDDLARDAEQTQLDPALAGNLRPAGGADAARVSKPDGCAA